MLIYPVKLLARVVYKELVPGFMVKVHHRGKLLAPFAVPVLELGEHKAI